MAMIALVNDNWCGIFGGWHCPAGCPLWSSAECRISGGEAKAIEIISLNVFNEIFDQMCQTFWRAIPLKCLTYIEPRPFKWFLELLFATFPSILIATLLAWDMSVCTGATHCFSHLPWEHFSALNANKVKCLKAGLKATRPVSLPHIRTAASEENKRNLLLSLQKPATSCQTLRRKDCKEGVNPISPRTLHLPEPMASSAPSSSGAGPDPNSTSLRPGDRNTSKRFLSNFKKISPQHNCRSALLSCCCM